MNLLVQWTNENPKSWSVVSTDKLVDGTLRKSKVLRGKTVAIQWKRSIHEAIVIDSSIDAAFLENQADDLAKKEFDSAKSLTSTNRKRLSERSIDKDATSMVDAVQSVSAPKEYSKASAVKKSRAKQIKLVLDSASVDDSPDNSSMPLEVNDDSTNEIRDFHAKYLDCKSKLKNLRKKYRTLKRTHSRCSDDEFVEIGEGSGLTLARSEISALKTMSPSITFFARNMFRRAFSMEEIIGHSLLGRKSTAQVNHIPLPEIDPRRRDGIIELCLRTYGLELEPGASLKLVRKRKAAKTKIIKSLSDYFREENTKAKKQ